MKRSQIAFGLLLLFGVLLIKCSVLRKGENIKEDIKILTYNVRNCQGLDGNTDYSRIASVIRHISPDVVALQELDSVTQRSNGYYVLDVLSGLTGMEMTFGASIDFQGGKYGIGILTKEKPVSWEVISLPGREEKRSLLVVELENYIICCTHLSLNPEDRLLSVNLINNKLRSYTKPVFLAGDFNAVPESPVITGMLNNWLKLNTDDPTFPSNDPQRCIDYIFASKFTGHSFVVRKTIVEKGNLASDHLPVWVEVSID